MEARLRKAGNTVIASYKFQQGVNGGINGQSRAFREESSQRYETTGAPPDSVEEEVNINMNNSFPQSEHMYQGSNQSQPYVPDGRYPTEGFANTNHSLPQAGHTNQPQYNTHQQQSHPSQSPLQYGAHGYNGTQGYGPAYETRNDTAYGSESYNQGSRLEAQTQAHPMQSYENSYNSPTGHPVGGYPMMGQKQRAYTIQVTETGPPQRSPPLGPSPAQEQASPFGNNSGHGNNQGYFDDIVNSAGAQAHRGGQPWQNGARSSTSTW